MIDGIFEAEVAAARSAVDKLARGGNLSAGVASTLGDLVRLIDVLTSSTKEGFYRLESEIGLLKEDVQRLRAEAHRLEATASTAHSDTQSLEVEMRGLDRLDKQLDQSLSHIADRVTALESAAPGAISEESPRSQ